MKNKIDLGWCVLELIWQTTKEGKIKTVTMKFSDPLGIRTVFLRFSQEGIYKINISEKQRRIPVDGAGKRVEYEQLVLDKWLKFMEQMESYQKGKAHIDVLVMFLVSIELGNVIISFDKFFGNIVKDFDIVLKN